MLTKEQLQKIRSVKGIRNFTLVVEERALLQKTSDSLDYQSIIYLKGVDENYADVNPIQQNIIQGSFETGDAENPFLVMGAGIQHALYVQSDQAERLVVYLPRKGNVNLSDPFQSLSSEAANTSGAFIIQQDFDNKYVLTNLDFVKRMLAMDADAYNGVEIAISPGSDPDDIRDQLQKLLGDQYLVQNRFEQNANLYSVMRIEKWFIYAVLSLILVVAAFNMVGALTMLVLEKKHDISVLHALGASRSFIQRIFLSEGMLLALIGGGTGMLLAFIIGQVQIKYHIIPLTGSTFMIDYFPVKMVLADFLLVSLTILIIALFAAWLPARKAALQQFGLREE